MYTGDPISNAIEGLSELRIRYQFGDVPIDQIEKSHRIEKLNQAKDAVKAMQMFIADIRFSLGDFTDEHFRSLVKDTVKKFDERMKTIQGA